MMRYGFVASVCILALLAHNAMASTLEARVGKAKPSLLWDATEVAVFQRQNDLWLVTSDTTPLKVNIADQDAVSLGIIAQEKLQVRGGQGVRLSFSALPGVEALQKEGRFELDITARPAPVQQLLSFKRGTADLSWTAPQAGRMLRAFSPTTKETYPVLTTGAVAGMPKAMIQANVQFLPTTLGAVLVSRTGQLMNITGDATQGFNLKHKLPEIKPQTVSAGTYGDELGQLMALFPIDPSARSTFVNALTQTKNAVAEAQRVAERLLAPSPTELAPQSLPPLGNMPLQSEEVKAALPAAPQTSEANSLAPTAPFLPTPTVSVSSTTTESMAEVVRRYAPRSYAAVQREAMMAFVAAQTEEARQQAILDWAKMMFSFERYAEVIGLLQTLPLDPNTNLPLLTEARLLEAAASMMLGRVADAERILQTISENSPQLQLWQAAAKTERGQYTEALTQFTQFADGMDFYPDFIKRQLEVWALMAAYGAERYADIPPQAQMIIDRDAEGTLPIVRLIQAKAQIKQGQGEAARDALTALQKSPDPFVRVQADIATTALALDNGDITVEEAFTAFEKSRFAWRGDQVERDLTFDLANLYLKNSRYLEALELFKYYTVVFPNATHSADAARLMTEVFNQLFTTDLAEQVLDPLTQLALYYEFRELTPPGPQGDAIMKRVVRKLADTSLYPRAIDLLERLITFRLQSPVDKAEAGLTLAELHFANRSYPEGLKALSMTATSGLLPVALHEQRQLLQGKLYQALGQFNEALQAVASFQTKPADYLRASIAWTNNSYPEVMTLLAPYFQNREVAATWQTDDHIALMQLALAYALKRQPEDLARLYTNFTQEIGLLKLDGAFLFLRDLAGEAGNEVQSQDLWQNLLKALGTVRHFEDFYDKFRALRYTRPDKDPAKVAAQP